MSLPAIRFILGYAGSVPLFGLPYSKTGPVASSSLMIPSSGTTTQQTDSSALVSISEGGRHRTITCIFSLVFDVDLDCRGRGFFVQAEEERDAYDDDGEGISE